MSVGPGNSTCVTDVTVSVTDVDSLGVQGSTPRAADQRQRGNSTFVTDVTVSVTDVDSLGGGVTGVDNCGGSPRNSRGERETAFGGFVRVS